MIKRAPTVYSLMLFFLFVNCTDANLDKVVENSVGLDASPLNIVPEFHASHEPAKQNAPFSDVVRVGNTFYLSGQIGMDQKTRTLVPGGIQLETKQTLENIKAVLAHHGLEMQDVVKALVVLDDIRDFAAFNEIYQKYFPQKPARTTFAAESLAVGAKIEIEVVAVKSQ